MLPASYVERLIWHFFKTRVFGGLSLFIHRCVFVETILVIAVLVLEVIGPTRWIPLAVSVLLLLSGLIAPRRAPTLRDSLIIAGIAVLIVVGALLGIRPPLIPPMYAVLGIVFLWLLFNAAVFLVQMWDFFASTGGLYMLLGSDKNRVFLSPIPQILCTLVVAITAWRIIGNITIVLILGAIAVLVPVILLYMCGRYGRILRAGLSIYILVATYTAMGPIFGLSAYQSMLLWSAIVAMSTLFTVQQHALRLSRRLDGKTHPTMFTYAMLGVLLLVSYMLLVLPAGELLAEWWLISSASMAVAPLVALTYVSKTGRIKYYVRRDNVDFWTLLGETTKILGTIAISSIRKRMLSLISRV